MYQRVIDYRKEESIGDWPITKILEERIEIGRIDPLLYREIRLLPEEEMRRIKLEIESRIRGTEAELHISESQRTSLQKLQYIINKLNDPTMEFWGRPMKEKSLIQRKGNLSTLHGFIELEEMMRGREPTAQELSDWLLENRTPKSQMALLLLSEVSDETLLMTSPLLRERSVQLEAELRRHDSAQSEGADQQMMQATRMADAMTILWEEIERRLRPPEHDEDLDQEDEGNDEE